MFRVPAMLPIRAPSLLKSVGPRSTRLLITFRTIVVIFLSRNRVPVLLVKGRAVAKKKWSRLIVLVSWARSGLTSVTSNSS